MKTIIESKQLAKKAMGDLSILTPYEKDKLLQNIIFTAHVKGSVSVGAIEKAIDEAVGTSQAESPVLYAVGSR
ncbi:hypothetical protein C4B60_00700 [Jeotgalibacillus proteolyticus]|uniref:Uncharacterized protein n=1 Tax=Jeotgalibacillus proteolyticus TaxID=2082395 RepID=A0A2S5GG07_9BACL|nr:hypothetical protein C4B60_00700 [Jeotgalibacillus proteolyticus]